MNTNVPAKVKNVPRAKPLDSKEILELINRVEEAFVVCCAELESKVAHIVQSGVGATSEQQVAAFNVDSEQCRSIAEKLITFLPDIRFCRTDTTLVELCAGRGYLSSEILRQLPLPRLVLVDRRPFRFKADRFLKRQYETHRWTVDLKDLDLYRSQVLAKSKVLVVGKHLCGEATDYALRCAVESKCNSTGPDTPKLRSLYGLGLAPCCHHSCRWLTFINTPFLERLGINEVMFPCLARMSSWATLSDSHGCKSSRSDNTYSSLLPDTKLQRHEKVVIGRKIKFILNTARVVWLREKGFDAHLDMYVDLKLTPENMLILARCL
jgi:tRNA:m4X modification enzyme